MKPMWMYAIGSALMVFAVSLSYPVEAISFAGLLFVIGAFGRWIAHD